MLFKVVVTNKQDGITREYIAYVDSDNPLDAEQEYMNSEYKSYGDSVYSVENIGEGNVVRIL